MAVRAFDDDEITLAAGALTSFPAGAWTVLCLFNASSIPDFVCAMSFEATGSQRLGIWITDAGALMANISGQNRIFTDLTVTPGNWYLAVVKKASGTAAPRANLYDYLGEAWAGWVTHADENDADASTITDVRIGDWVNNNPFAGLIGGGAVYASELADNVAEGLNAAAADWDAAGAVAGWLLSQASTATPVPDFTGGGADQTALSGTTVVTDDDPPGFSFTLDGDPEEHEGAGEPAGVTLAAGSGAGSPHVTGAGAAVSLSLAAAAGNGFSPTSLVNWLLFPSAFGYPDDTNTGPSGTLTPSGRLVVNTEGAVIEDLDITDLEVGLAVEVRASNVTIRNCRITAVPQSGGGCIKQVNAAAGLVVEDCELTYAAVGSGDACVGESDYTLRRCHIHHVAEGPRIGDNTVVEDCYIHTLLVDDPEAHADAVQSTGGSNIRIEHNTIVADQEGADFANAALIIGAEFAVSDGIAIQSNLLAGGGFTFYLGPSAEFAMSDVTVAGNRFGRQAAFGPTSVDELDIGITGLLWYGNVFDDDLEPVFPKANIADGAGSSAGVVLLAGVGLGKADRGFGTTTMLAPRVPTARVLQGVPA